jgi:hypothetical protein
MVKYEWRKDGEILGYGITDDLERRREEHTREEPGSVVRRVGLARSEDDARAWGRKQIRKYEKGHGALPPKNKPRS